MFSSRGAARAGSETAAHEAGHRLFVGLDLDDATVTAGLGRHERSASHGLLSPRPGAFVIGTEAYVDVHEAVAETFAAYVLDRRALGPAEHRWLEHTLRDHGPEHWRETVQQLRKDPEWGDEHGVYRCGYCGHRWLEVGGSGVG